MKKKYLLVLLLIPIFLVACTNKKQIEFVCKKTMNYSDSQIDWRNEIDIKYSSDNEVDNIIIKEIITVDQSVAQERIDAFKNKIELECTGELGEKFDSCELKQDDNVFTITLNTKKLDILDSAIASSENQNVDSNSSISKLVKYLKELNYTCEEV